MRGATVSGRNQLDAGYQLKTPRIVHPEIKAKCPEEQRNNFVSFVHNFTTVSINSQKTTSVNVILLNLTPPVNEVEGEEKRGKFDTSRPCAGGILWLMYQVGTNMIWRAFGSGCSKPPSWPWPGAPSVD